MPQLVKGGKYVFAWSVVSNSGRIKIPGEAQTEYGLKTDEKIIIMNGSRTSKGFAITYKERIQNSILYNQMAEYPDLTHFRELENGMIKIKKRIYTWSEIDSEGYFHIPQSTLNHFDVDLNDRLLVVRGSGFALGFIKTGPIVEEALKHPGIITCSQKSGSL